MREQVDGRRKRLRDAKIKTEGRKEAFNKERIINMLLTIDIGNTNITLGIFKAGEAKLSAKPERAWRLFTNKSETADEYGQKILDLFRYDKLDSSKVSAVAIASVVPVLDQVFNELSLKYFGKKAFFVEPDPKILKMKYDNPCEVGADRICDAVAAWNFLKKSAIIIDFGTATTFDCIDENGYYLGGAIAPGPLISAESLAKKTAKLPQVEIIKPKSAIGKSTIKCIQAGLYYGYVGLIKEILKRITSEMKSRPVIIATGGLAGLIVPEIEEVKKILPDLTLEGIRIIWQKRNLL